MMNGKLVIPPQIIEIGREVVWLVLVPEDISCLQRKTQDGYEKMPPLINEAGRSIGVGMMLG